MVIKVNKDLEHKLNFIAAHNKKGKMEIEPMMEKIITAFIKRFEDQHGPIPDEMTTKQVVVKKPNLVYQMYEHYMEVYFNTFAKEYTVEKSKKPVDMRHMKLVRDKIAKTIAERVKTEVLAIKDEDVLAAFKYILSKMPEWWLMNSFTPASLASNYDKIMIQIMNPKINSNGKGPRSTKDALDDYILGLGGRSV